MAGVCALCGAGLAHAAPVTYRTVVLSGDTAPGTNAQFSFIFQPVFNGLGQTAFFSAITGPGVTIANNRGIWSGAGGSLGLVARLGDTAPGTTAQYSDLSINPVLNGQGQIALSALLTGTGATSANNSGIWSDAGGSLELVARRGNTAPGTNAQFSNFYAGNPVFNG